jgi:hypothetical protein
MSADDVAADQDVVQAGEAAASDNCLMPRAAVGPPPGERVAGRGGRFEP